MTRFGRAYTVCSDNGGHPDMFSGPFEIEGDLQRLSLIRQEATRSTASCPFAISDTFEIDLSRLSNRAQPEKGVGRGPQLKDLSKELFSIHELVSQNVAERIEIYREQHPDSPIFSAVTLFGPIDYGRLETATTRAIAWLLDPNMPHGLGSDVARSLLSLLGAEAKEKQEAIHVESVVPEYRTKNGKRIDVWMEGNKASGGRSMSVPWTIFIEAKIDASESADQLKAYEAEIPKNRDWYGIYLTPDGCKPSGDRWVPVSFQQLAKNLVACYECRKAAAGAAFLKLFIAGLLQDVLDRPLPIPGHSFNSFHVADLMTSFLEQ